MFHLVLPVIQVFAFQGREGFLGIILPEYVLIIICTSGLGNVTLKYANGSWFSASLDRSQNKRIETSHSLA